MLFIGGFFIAEIFEYTIVARFLTETAVLSGFGIMALSSGEREEDIGCAPGMNRTWFSFTRRAEKWQRIDAAFWSLHAWMDSWRGLAILWGVYALFGIINDYAPLYTVLLATGCSAIVWLVALRWTGRESSF